MSRLSVEQKTDIDEYVEVSSIADVVAKIGDDSQRSAEEGLYMAKALMKAYKHDPDAIELVSLDKGVAKHFGEAYAQQLIQTGDLNDMSKMRLFVHSASLGFFSVVADLLEEGVDINAKISVDRRWEDSGALCAALNAGHYKMVDYLLDSAQGADLCVDMPNPEGETALCIALKHGSVSAVKRLMAAGASLDVKTASWVPLPFLMLDHGSYWVADLLDVFIEHGFDMNKRYNDMGGDSLLLSAAFQGNIPLVQALIERGADLHVRNDMGETVVMNAVQGGHQKILKLVIDAGANVSLLTDAGVSAEKIARERGYGELHSIISEALLKDSLSKRSGEDNRAIVRSPKKGL